MLTVSSSLSSQVNIFADTASGYVSIVSSGGNGNQGQSGADGLKGDANTVNKSDKEEIDCVAKAKRNYYGNAIGCTENIPGTRGEPGNRGCDGGYAGKSGKGGDAGRQKIYVSHLRGKIELETCNGLGGKPAFRNGVGGEGGQGSLGGLGIKCRFHRSCGRSSCNSRCYANGRTSRADRGPRGAKGGDGKTELSAGSDGQVENSYLQKSDLSRNAKDQYPLVLIKLMTRYGEDLIWANKISDAKAVFNFIDTLTEKRSDANDLRNGKFTLVTFIDPNKSPQIA
ncbi:hypothetical protein ACROYT_G004895 [Oculina patagonica]